MRILLIEDDELVQKALLRFIKGVHPFAITNVVDNAPAAIEHLNTFAYDYIVSDYDLKEGTGGQVLWYIREHLTVYLDHNRFILMSGDLRPEITNLDHPLTFEKPISPKTLRDLLTGGHV
jgi:DNA-binding NarL/FixJ family response regulator